MRMEGPHKREEKNKEKGRETGDPVSPQDWPLVSEVRKLWLNFHWERLRDKQMENREKHIHAMKQREGIHKRRRSYGWEIKKWWKTRHFWNSINECPDLLLHFDMGKCLDSCLFRIINKILKCGLPCYMFGLQFEQISLFLNQTILPYLASFEQICFIVV